MTPAEIFAYLKKEFGDAILELQEKRYSPFITVAPENIRDLLFFLKEDPELDFNYLCLLSGVDLIKDNKIAVVYHLESLDIGHKIAIKSLLPRENPVTASAIDIWRTADWHEREAFDLLGVHFEGHPNLTRILTPDDWEGHPLRKDYVQQKTYHGLPTD